VSNWTVKDIPNQTDRVAIVTGANSGLGYQSSLALAKKGATVVMACRNQKQGQQALDQIKQQVPNARLELASLDLSDLASIHTFATEFKLRHDKLDVLLNNAGIMAIPRGETKDGFEMQLGVNHLGHFALTGLVLENLLNTAHSRVVTTTSLVHAIGRINFENLQMQRRYTRYGAYAQSKLANLLFAFELQRRLKAIGADVISVAAHPGYANTSLQNTSATASGSLLESLWYPIGNTIMAQSAEMGALPQLYAATAPEIKGGELYGPLFLTRGQPRHDWAMPAAYNQAVAQRLWVVSEELTTVHYNFTKPAIV